MTVHSAADPTSRRSRRRRLAPRALLCALLIAPVTACSAGGDSEATAGDSASGSRAAPDDLDGGEAGVDTTGASQIAERVGAELTELQPLSGQYQVLRADLVVQTDAVLTDARRAAAAATAAGGVVTDEQTATELGSTGDDGDRTVSTLTMRVPPEALDELLANLSALGELVSQNRGTDDVTDEYVDVQARIVSQRASLDRLLALVTDASDLSDVVALENEVSRRQSDLDALVARQQALDEQVSMATVTLTLTSAADGPVASAGFLTGLGNGWDAFSASVVGALTVLGAVLPFLVLLALIAVPVYLVRTRRRSPRSAAAAEPPAA